jgi:hypothetical protein
MKTILLILFVTSAFVSVHSAQTNASSAVLSDREASFALFNRMHKSTVSAEEKSTLDIIILPNLKGFKLLCNLMKYVIMNQYNTLNVKFFMLYQRKKDEAPNGVVPHCGGSGRYCASQEDPSSMFEDTEEEGRPVTMNYISMMLRIIERYNEWNISSKARIVKKMFRVLKKCPLKTKKDSNYYCIANHFTTFVNMGEMSERAHNYDATTGNNQFLEDNSVFYEYSYFKTLNKSYVPTIEFEGTTWYNVRFYSVSKRKSYIQVWNRHIKPDYFTPLLRVCDHNIKLYKRKRDYLSCHVDYKGNLPPFYSQQDLDSEWNAVHGHHGAMFEAIGESSYSKLFALVGLFSLAAAVVYVAFKKLSRRFRVSKSHAYTAEKLDAQLELVRKSQGTGYISN